MYKCSTSPLYVWVKKCACMDVGTDADDVDTVKLFICDTSFLSQLWMLVYAYVCCCVIMVGI